MTYVPIYLDDLFGSPTVDRMDATLFGAYMAVFLRMYQMGGSIPGDDATLRRYSKLTAQQWRSNRVALRELFDCLPNGCLTHKRVASELAKLSEKLQNRRAAGVSGAKARWQTHADANGKRMANAKQSHDFANGIPEPEPEPNTSTDVDVTPLPPVGGRSVKKPDDVVIPAALNTPEFGVAWHEWIAYRREAKKALPPRSQTMQLNNLAQYGPAVAIEAIRQSIRCGWQGLFPEKININPTNGNQPARPGFQRGSFIPDANTLGEALARSHAARVQPPAPNYNPGTREGQGQP